MKNKETTLLCDDCHGKFVFTSDEQQFFFEKGYQNPKRCKPCRTKKKGIT